MSTFDIPTASSGGEFKLVPPGLYVMSVKAMERIEPKPDQPSQFEGKVDGPRVKWVFSIDRIIDVDDEDADALVGEEFWAWTSLSMNIKSTMRTWSSALLGRPIEDGERVTPDMLMDKAAKVTVISYTKLNGNEGRKVGSMTPMRTAKAGQAAPIIPAASSRSAAAPKARSAAAILDGDGDEPF